MNSCFQYSGLCEQTMHSYLIISVRYIRQSRSDMLVEPEIPLLDLIPALADTIEDTFAGVTKSQSRYQHVIGSLWKI